MLSAVKPAFPRPHPWSRRSLLAPFGGRLPAGYRASGMRRAAAIEGRATAAPNAPALPPLAVIALNRIAFGHRPGDLAAFAALGSDDTQRLTAWVDQQLAPGSISDSQCDAKIIAAGYQTLGKSLTQLFQDHYLADPPEWEVRLQPALEVELATWTRAVWSRRQLLEAMAHFWHNHFSLYAYEFVEGPVFAHFDRDVIRANALGNFRTLLEAVAQAPAMLVYLDNFINFADSGIGYSNENFARELLELHTLGAEVSYGTTPRDQIPVDGGGVPVGYCEEDVQDVARALTGWTFDIDWIWGQPGTTGEFVYRDDLHSTEAKIVLGSAIPSGQTAAADGGAVLDLVAQHPATGRHLAEKVCRRFLADEPPAALVDSAGALFTSLWQAPDQIAQVVRHILLSTEFRTTWGEKIKRPFEIAVSALRAVEPDFTFTAVFPYPPDWGTWPKDMQDTSSFHWLFEAAHQMLFGMHTPDGHADMRPAWQCSSPRVACWRLVNWLVEADNASGAWRLAVISQTPAGVRSANEIVDYWIDRILGRAIPTADREQLVDFMAAGHNPDLDLPLDSDEDTQDRLRSLVALTFMSPEFLWR